jgi:hypothetical protein
LFSYEIYKSRILALRLTAFARFLPIFAIIFIFCDLSPRFYRRLVKFSALANRFVGFDRDRRSIGNRLRRNGAKRQNLGVFTHRFSIPFKTRQIALR